MLQQEEKRNKIKRANSIISISTIVTLDTTSKCTNTSNTNTIATITTANSTILTTIIVSTLELFSYYSILELFYLCKPNNNDYKYSNNYHNLTTLSTE